MAFNQDETTYTEHGRRIPRPSHNFVPEYQMSGIPHVETRTLGKIDFANGARVVPDTHKFEFKSVTRWFSIHGHDNNDNSHIRVYFNKTAAQTQADTHYYLLDGIDSTVRFEIKCKEIYVVPAADNTIVSVIAGLTSVDANDFPNQTKDNGFLGVEN